MGMVTSLVKVSDSSTVTVTASPSSTEFLSTDRLTWGVLDCSSKTKLPTDLTVPLTKNGDVLMRLIFSLGLVA